VVVDITNPAARAECDGGTRGRPPGRKRGGPRGFRTAAPEALLPLLLLMMMLMLLLLLFQLHWK